MSQRIETQPSDHSAEPVMPGDIGYIHAPEEAMYTGPAVMTAPESAGETLMIVPPAAGEHITAVATEDGGTKLVIRAHRTADGGLVLSGGPYASRRRSARATSPVEAPAVEAVDAVEEISVPEAAPRMERAIKTVYEKSADNRKQTAAVFDAENHKGLPISLSEGRNQKREAVVTTASGKRYYVIPFEHDGVNMQVAYDIEKSKAEGRQIADTVVLDANQSFTPIVIGEGWNMVTETTDPVVEVSVAMHKFNASQLKSSKFAEGGEDPFEAVRAELAAIPFAEPEQPAVAEEADVAEPVADTSVQETVTMDAVEADTEEFEAVEEEQGMNLRERIKAKMAAAAAQLKLIARNPVYGTQMVAMNTLSAVTNRENYTRRRGITAGVAGGLALATIAILELKGVSVFGHAAEHKNSVSNHDMSNALIPAPKHSNNHHDVASALTPSHNKAHHAAEVKHHLSHAHGASHGHDAAHHASGHSAAHGHKTVTMNHTVWETAQKDMGLDHAKHLTPAQQHAIYEHTARILHANHLSWDDARHLTKGTKLKV